MSLDAVFEKAKEFAVHVLHLGETEAEQFINQVKPVAENLKDELVAEVTAAVKALAPELADSIKSFLSDVENKSETVIDDPAPAPAAAE